MYVYFITYPLILITSPVAILNSPINLFCPLDTVLVLTPHDVHSIFPTTPPSLIVLYPLWWYFYKTLTWCCLYCVLTYTYSLLSEKDIVIIKMFQLSFRVFVSAFCLDISSFFSVRVSSFFSYFLSNQPWVRDIHDLHGRDARKVVAFRIPL